MSEEEWLACEEPLAMLEALPGTASARRLRLFLVACSRLPSCHTADERVPRVLAVVERFAEGLAGEGELDHVREAAVAARERAYARPAGPGGASAGPALRAAAAAFNCAVPTRLLRASLQEVFRTRLAPAGIEAGERAAQARLLRCIMGNIFRPFSLPPSFITPTVLSLALAAYDDRALPSGTLDPQRLAVLADALEDAGCIDAAILGHLRGPGPHVRGCYLLDAVLDRR